MKCVCLLSKIIRDLLHCNWTTKAGLHNPTKALLYFQLQSINQSIKIAACGNVA